MRTRRFGYAQRLFANQPHDAAGTLAGRLICLDMIRPSRVAQALSSTPYKCDGSVYLEWSEPEGGRLERRALSVLSTLSDWRQPRDASGDVGKVAAVLEAVPEYRRIEAGSRVVELERDLACWAALNLPMTLFAHVVGLRRMAPLPRHFLALSASSLALKAPVSDQSCLELAEVAEMLDHALSTGRKSDNDSLVKLAVAMLSVKEGEAPTETFHRWTRSLLTLRARVRDGDVASAVVVAWLIDLAESGTITGPDTRPETRLRYARVTALAFWRAFSNLPVDVAQWTFARRKAAFESLLADPSVSDLDALSAAISSLQRFLEEVVGLAPVGLNGHRFNAEPMPRAQWVPDHVIERAVRWLDSEQKGDPRLLRFCALMILFARHCPVRLAELRWLRLRNIAVRLDGVVEVEITPIAGTHALKTDAAKRRVLIYDKRLAGRLLALCAERRAQGVDEDALLFAAPGEDNLPYRPYAIHAVLLRVLKHASGDPGMTFYALRHTCISDFMNSLLMSSAVVDTNRLTHLSDVVGHVVPVTTLAHYSHIFEAPLRLHIDAALQDDVDFSAADGERLLAIKANTISQAARRSKHTIGWHVWRRLDEKARLKAAEFEDLVGQFEWHEPPAPGLGNPVARNFTVADCLDLLQMLVVDRDREVVRHRFQLTKHELSSLEDAALAVLAQIHEARGRQRPGNVLGLKAILRHLGINLRRSSQKRYEQLRAYFALPIDVDVVRTASIAWTQSRWKGYLSADPPSRLTPMLRLLQRAGVDPAALVVNVVADSTDGRPCSFETQAQAVFLAVFNDHVPLNRRVYRRRGRPPAYLLWPSHPGAASAGSSNGGLDAYMFCAAVWCQPEVQRWA